MTKLSDREAVQAATVRLPAEAMACDTTRRANQVFEIDAPVHMVLGSNG